VSGHRAATAAAVVGGTVVVVVVVVVVVEAGTESLAAWLPQAASPMLVITAATVSAAVRPCLKGPLTEQTEYRSADRVWGMARG
jgi:hypothetical protein